ncbi:hypothetical protein Bca52824_046122 [Brassica carinata]|uniref:Uncharacterized protein n=1 Tax=Brassica carinata TaxID=52824 RepID=A0A8X7RGK3_BRACI|nr:hypothetical protein Bca52824_046122 [Brassica carinata]
MATSSTTAPEDPPLYGEDSLSNVPHETIHNDPTAISSLATNVNLPQQTLSNVPDDAAHLKNAETSEQDPTPFVPSLGAWSKRLVFQFSPPRTPPEPSTPRNYNPELVQ